MAAASHAYATIKTNMEKKATKKFIAFCSILKG